MSAAPKPPDEERRIAALHALNILDSDADHGYIVVHGHTITRAVDERANRIGIDTGAYMSGRLTALVLEGDTRRYPSTRE